ncbi:MAG: preprotein translocase subunit YajC [Bacillota bacterium]|nr:preprotein translocase subunit YajC [Bacillota bacterium]
MFLNVFAEPAKTTTTAAGGYGGYTSLIIMLAIFAVFYVILILPQKKQEKKQRAMLNALQVGDEIVTIGGIYGKIIKVTDDYLVLETSADKTKIKMSRSSVSKSLTTHDAAPEENK